MVGQNDIDNLVEDIRATKAFPGFMPVEDRLAAIVLDLLNQGASDEARQHVAVLRGRVSVPIEVLASLDGTSPI